MDAFLIPVAGIIAAVGVAMLLVTSMVPLRVVGAVLIAAGGGPLVVTRTSLTDQLLDRPALLGAGLVAAVVALAVLTLVFERYPWLVPVTALLIGLRIPCVRRRAQPTTCCHSISCWQPA